MEQDRVKRTGGRTKLWLLSLIWLLWCICSRIILCFPFDECRKWFTCNCYFPTDLLIGPRQGGRLDQLLMASNPSHCLVAAAHSFESCCSLGRECKLKCYARKQWQTHGSRQTCCMTLGAHANCSLLHSHTKQECLSWVVLWFRSCRSHQHLTTHRQTGLQEAGGVETQPGGQKRSSIFLFGILSADAGHQNI